MGLKIHIKQLDVIGKKVFPGQQIHYSGLSPATIIPALGPLPSGSPRRWPEYGSFMDVTSYIEDVNKVKLTWSEGRDVEGVFVAQVQPKKSATGSVQFSGTAYRLLKAWLLDDVSATLNSVQVKIEDVGCGFYENYVIKGDGLQWCEDGFCTFDVTIKQQDENINCIKRTLIGDNWQGWFQKVPSNGKKHPRFSYCNEAKPNTLIVAIWYILITVFSTNLVFIGGILFAINSIIWLINVIKDALDYLGVNVSNWNIPDTISMNDLYAGLATIFIESAGCGREHPSPLIRDYISNVCDRCGIAVNAQSAALFFAPSITFDTSNGPKSETNMYYSACYFSAEVNRGIRRFRRTSILYGYQDPNDEFWIPENQPLLSLDLFLDKICPLFNHEWRISNNTLYIQRKDYYVNADYAYDFTEGSPDRDKIVQGVCYEPNGVKYPAYCVGIYSGDSTDACAQEVAGRNGSGQANGIVSFGDVDSNPNFEGVLDKTQPIGGARFRFDGASEDYIYDALQMTFNLQMFNPIGMFLPYMVLREVEFKLAPYADYNLLMSGETAELPKILIWDRVSYENAHALRYKSAWYGVAFEPTPDPNPLYNTTGQPWQSRHYPHTDVKGRGSQFTSVWGLYRIQDLFGGVVAERAAMLVNYPMYFEPFYKDTLWDRFHWIDDPRRNPVLNLNWTVKIELCCPELKYIGVFNDASAILLGQRVKLDASIFYKDGVLREITASYDPEDLYGRYIELKGTL